MPWRSQTTLAAISRGGASFVQEPRGAAARELGFDSSQARATPNHVRGSCSPSYSKVVRVDLAYSGQKRQKIGLK